MERTIDDGRSAQCVEHQYRKPLPTTTVIIVFHNEAWCTLLRTIYSVLATTPKIVLEEIILVDDMSNLTDRPELGDDLSNFVNENFPGFVRILRQSTREGLIAARLAGAAAATGVVLTFLDSHCECTVGWIEPLLERIAQN